jgi:hypothetical protein
MEEVILQLLPEEKNEMVQLENHLANSLLFNIYID